MENLSFLGTLTEASMTGCASECLGLRSWVDMTEPTVWRLFSFFIRMKLSCNFCRYVYDFIGGDHDKIFKELLATICTFAITTLWLGPCELVYIWSFFNCFGLNFELWVAKFFSIPPFSTIEVRNKIKIILFQHTINTCKYAMCYSLCHFSSCTRVYCI